METLDCLLLLFLILEEIEMLNRMTIANTFVCEGEENWNQKMQFT